MRDRLAKARASEFGPVRVSLTDDLWTSRSNRGHVGVNAAVLSPDFDMVSLALGCRYFPYPHDADTIAMKVREVLNGYGLSAMDLAAITTDKENTAVA